jgi:hypothetical protein
MGQKRDYLRDRIVNAVDMLRSGQLQLFTTSLQIEISKRHHEVLNFFSRKTGVKLIRRPDSAYINRRIVIPPSYRPTQLHGVVVAELGDESAALEKEIQDIIASISLQGNEIK